MEINQEHQEEHRYIYKGEICMISHDLANRLNLALSFNRCHERYVLDRPIKICEECADTYENCDCYEDDGTPIRYTSCQ